MDDLDAEIARDFAREEWDRLLSRDPDALVVAEPAREITVGDLVWQARRQAGRLIAHGVTQGDRVIVARPNSIEFVVDYLAIRLCGGVLVNLPWSAGTSITVLAEILDARCVILTEELVGDNPLFDQLGGRRFRPDEDAAVGPAAPPPRRADEVCWLACTSGTTGVPKAAMHTFASLERQTEVFAQHFQLTASDPILVTSPVGHAVALLFGVRMSLMLNSVMVLVPRWRIETAVELIERHGCVFTVAPTPFLVDMVVHAEEHGVDRIKSLRFFPSAGAPVPRSLVMRGLKAMPHCQVWSYFGTSEAGAVTAVPLDAALPERLDTDGIAMPGTRTRVVDGELMLHSPRQMMKGYWAGDPGGRLAADGWYATGDAAEQRPDGYIKMIGRAKDIILRGGENISPLEIENVLLGHPNVTDVAIIGYPDDRLGSRLAAVVVKAGPATLDALRDHCQAVGLDKAKWPEFMTEVDAIPLSAIGKVRRGELEEMVAARVGAGGDQKPDEGMGGQA
jgi:cyclohexanecarboxylate-CoA ligase